MTTTTVLIAILALPPFHLDKESREERAARLLPAAEAIASVAKSPEQAAFLIAQAWHESRYAKYVTENRCADGPPGMRCDPDRNGTPRARGIFQVWANACRADDLRGQAKCVLGIGKLGLQRCASWSGAFFALRGHWACGEDAAREQTMRSILAKWGRKP